MAHHQRRTLCNSAGRVSARVLLSFFALSSFATTTAAASKHDRVQLLPQLPIGTPDSPVQIPQGKEVDLHLKHILHYGTHEYPGLARKYDIRPETFLSTEENGIQEEASTLDPVRLRAWQTHIYRLADRSLQAIDSILDSARVSGKSLTMPASAWKFDELYGPNYTDKDTVLGFAKICNNAYKVDPKDSGWEDVRGGFNYTEDFGWENDGLRGHIYADKENSTVVIGLKGTSPAVFDGSGTTTKDKENDNLFFGCCCGQGSVMWHKSCDCQTSTYTCNNTCVSENLRQKNRYYYAARELYRNVTELYPKSEIWLTGHSLGGSTMALVAATYGHPVMTFAAPGNAMAAKRLGLPTPPDYHLGSISEVPWKASEVHFGHTADPIFMGECNGASSVCSIGGYSMESICHVGLECVYNTVMDLGWLSRAWNHGIATYIHQVIDVYNETAKCVSNEDCTDCYLWKFFEGNASDPIVTTTTTTTIDSFTQTRTETCKTPGWWGCLDETTSTTTTTTTTSTSTSTCQTPGWFGCLDPTTSTTQSITTDSPSKALPSQTVTITTSPPTSTPSPSITSSTTSCETPGLIWGCWDKTSTSSSPPMSSPKVTTSLPPITTTRSSTTERDLTSTCTHPGIFWGCWDPTTPVDRTHTATASEPTRSSSTTECETPGLFWGCWNAQTAAAFSSNGAVLTNDVHDTAMIITEAPLVSSLPTPGSQYSTITESCGHAGWFGECWDWIMGQKVVQTAWCDDAL